MTVIGWARQISDDGSETSIPVYGELQVMHDGLTLGTCLAIARRLEKYPNVTMPGMRMSLTPAQQAAVDQHRAVHG